MIVFLNCRRWVDLSYGFSYLGTKKMPQFHQMLKESSPSLFVTAASVKPDLTVSFFLFLESKFSTVVVDKLRFNWQPCFVILSGTFFCLGRRRYASSSDNVPNNSVVNLQNYKEVEENHRPPNVTSKTKSSWLMLNKTRRAAPTQLLTTSVKSIPIGNHYTVEETYTSVNEAVYTELDRIPSPAYQNNGYMLEMDHEPNSSAPSSAYYSDISAHGAYEIVGQTPISNCVNLRSLRRMSNVRYSSTDENVSVNSNYIWYDQVCCKSRKFSLVDILKGKIVRCTVTNFYCSFFKQIFCIFSMRNVCLVVNNFSDFLFLFCTITIKLLFVWCRKRAPFRSRILCFFVSSSIVRSEKW